jgi:hypothetical protein
MQKGNFIVVDAPGNYANSQLNGSVAEVTHVGNDVVCAVLVGGPHDGQEWQFNPAHVRPANKSMHLTALRRWWAERTASHLVEWSKMIREHGGR